MIHRLTETWHCAHNAVLLWRKVAGESSQTFLIEFATVWKSQMTQYRNDNEIMSLNLLRTKRRFQNVLNSMTGNTSERPVKWVAWTESIGYKANIEMDFIGRTKNVG